MIYFLVCIIVFISFKIPEILLKNENDIGLEIYERKKKSNQLDVEAGKIYLVKTIHEIEECKAMQIMTNHTQLMLSFNEMQIDKFKNVFDELLKLYEHKILNSILEDTNIDEKIDEVSLITKQYKSKANTYVVNNMVLKFNNKTFVLNIEEKTGKIIYIAFDKNDLSNQNDKKEILENFVKYLNLYVIGDWEYDADTTILKSEKAGLQVKWEESEEDVMLSIHII